MLKNKNTFQNNNNASNNIASSSYSNLYSNEALNAIVQRDNFKLKVLSNVYYIYMYINCIENNQREMNQLKRQVREISEQNRN